MSARSEILSRVRASLRPTAGAPQHLTARIRRPRDLQPDPVTLFASRVADFHAVVERCSSSELEARVRAALAGCLRVVVPVDLDLEVTDAVVDEELSLTELDACDAVVTRARLGIAETGTLVLDHGVGQGRRAISLVPDHHICLVEGSQVVPDVPDAFDLLDATRPLTWISGPSATSDIELQRVEGVHGPRRLHVIISEAAAPEAGHRLE